jgi:hypothetical protein
MDTAALALARGNDIPIVVSSVDEANPVPYALLDKGRTR